MAEEKKEQIYNIPLRAEWEKVPEYKRAKKAIRAIREFLVQHMKIYDRDLNKVKIGRWLNMHVWQRGIKKPPSQVKVKVTQQGEIVTAELAELPKKAIKEQAEEKAKETKGKKPAEVKKEPEKKEAEEKQEEKKPEENKKEEPEKKETAEKQEEKEEKAEEKK